MPLPSQHFTQGVFLFCCLDALTITAPLYRPAKTALGGWRGGGGISPGFISQGSVILIPCRSQRFVLGFAFCPLANYFHSHSLFIFLGLVFFYASQTSASLQV